MIDEKFLAAKWEALTIRDNFICLFDFFGKGRHVYTFRETCEEDSTLKLNDGTAKIFLNTKGIFDDAGGDFKAFLDFVEYGKISGEFVKKLAAAVQKVKLSLETRLIHDI